MKHGWRAAIALCVVGAMTFASATPEAQAEEEEGFSLGQKKYIKSQMSYFNRSGEDKGRMAKKCGYEPKATIDWASFRPVFDKLISKEINVSPWSFCGAPMVALKDVCADDDAKKVVQQKIQNYVCHYGGDGKFDIKLDKKSKTLHFYVDFKATNQWKKALTYLEKTL